MICKTFTFPRLCQNVGTTSFIFYSSAIFSFGYAAFSSCIWQQVAIFQLYRVINSPINIYLATVMSPFPSFISLAHIFLILKAIAKKAKSIVTLSSPTCRNLLYAMLYFICPNTASGSIHLLPLCLIPSSESNLLPSFHRKLRYLLKATCLLPNWNPLRSRYINSRRNK